LEAFPDFSHSLLKVALAACTEVALEVVIVIAAAAGSGAYHYCYRAFHHLNHPLRRRRRRRHRRSHHPGHHHSYPKTHSHPDQNSRTGSGVTGVGLGLAPTVELVGMSRCVVDDPTQAGMMAPALPMAVVMVGVAGPVVVTIPAAPGH
jgi:hypothetical protein